MKKIVIAIVTFFYFIPGFANHISGGELFYEYTGPGAVANTSRYRVTMRLFRDCNSSGQTLDGETVNIGIYKSNGLNLYKTLALTLVQPIRSIKLNTNTIPCLINAPNVCFQIGIFTGVIDLPATQDGFVLSWVRCCRPDDIANLSLPTGIGGTFVTSVPGTGVMPSGFNSSPQFAIKDTALVCQNKSFVLDFGASDNDGDSLSYSFCSAYAGGSSSNPNPGADPNGLTQTLQLPSLPYQAPFAGDSPLGSGVIINANTGKITGTAPAAGRYVINVCVTEWRNGIALNQHRKDFILAVGNCDYAGAEPVPLTGAWCKSFKVNFSNNNTSSTIQSYYWDFGVANSTTDTSTQPVPNYTYADTGTYRIKLVVHGSSGCVDSGSTTLGVYPGFVPDFSVTGSCFKSPFQFEDKTVSSYGSIRSRKWDFGDLTTNADVSTDQNPAYLYPAPANNKVLLVVTSSKGCVDSISKTIPVRDIPLLKLSFRDTLLCGVDSVQLHASGTGVFTWTPAVNISNPSSPDPVVYPADSTTYVVQLSEGSCSTRDSLHVNVIKSVVVNAGADTIICKTDELTLQPTTNGTTFLWTPVDGLLTLPSIKNPVARPDTTTQYTLTASVGKCQAIDTIIIRVVPYPTADAGPDMGICYGNRTQLTGVMNGTNFTWSPVNMLENATTLTPIAGPEKSTVFVLSVYDSLSGCPKPFRDSVVVRVVSQVKAFAGNDTLVVANQPLHLQASGGVAYVWTPTTGMNDPLIADPTVILTASSNSVVYKVRVSVPEGCFADDEVKVKVFKTAPDIFIPSGFTPNQDGRNDVLRPVPVGIASLEYFRVYNRWGQMIYSTSNINEGWDGSWKGKPQATGTYVFIARGIDYLGNTVFKKGTSVLIR